MCVCVAAPGTCARHAQGCNGQRNADMDTTAAIISRTRMRVPLTGDIRTSPEEGGRFVLTHPWRGYDVEGAGGCRGPREAAHTERRPEHARETTPAAQGRGVAANAGRRAGSGTRVESHASAENEDVRVCAGRVSSEHSPRESAAGPGVLLHGKGGAPATPAATRPPLTVGTKLVASGGFCLEVCGVREEDRGIPARP